MECLPRPREIDYFEKEWIISLFRLPLAEVGGPMQTRESIWGRLVVCA